MKLMEIDINPKRDKEKLNADNPFREGKNAECRKSF